MMFPHLASVSSWMLILGSSALASPVNTRAVTPVKRATDAYAPVDVTCPSTSLVRTASGISSSETTYRDARYTKASAALVSWLEKTNSNFVTSGSMPTLAVTTSGGGYRSLLSGAGVLQALDSRDSSLSTSGLYQAMTYQGGLSGGAWLLSSIAGNNYPTVSELQSKLWNNAFSNSLLIPENILAAPVAYADIISDIEAKEDAGFSASLTDPWGRLLAYQLLEGSDGGVKTTLSSLTSLSNFTSHNVPYPIIASLGVKVFENECSPGPNATQYEFHPYEFGSWDAGVDAFVQTAYLGTSLSNGSPTDSSCISNYDNLGYILGTSSTLFNELCVSLPTPDNSSSASIYSFIASIINDIHTLQANDEYGKYPNPFYEYSPSTLVSGQTELYLVDGGEALQNNPIWPFLHRDVDVMLVNDNSADSNENFPNGTEILTTYVQSLTAGLDRMPVIPSVDTFISEGLDQRATFFGCNDSSKITIVYLPNYNYTYTSGESTSKLQYSTSETAAMIANGNAIATQNGKDGWATCLGCAIMKKTGTTLPSECTACFDEYCYN